MGNVIKNKKKTDLIKKPCHMCYKEGIETGCNCKYICLNCITNIIKYSEICPNHLIKIKKKEIFYKCTTCSTLFSDILIDKINKNNEIQYLKRIIQKSS